MPTADASRPPLPRPDFSNTFCLVPINENWHLRKPADKETLTKTVKEMRDIFGPERLYAHLGVAIVSNGNERGTYDLARALNIGLVLQGGAIEHHSDEWGFLQLLRHRQQADRRLLQWFQDGRVTEDSKDSLAGVAACSSRYAKPVFTLRQKMGNRTFPADRPGLPRLPGRGPGVQRPDRVRDEPCGRPRVGRLQPVHSRRVPPIT